MSVAHSKLTQALFPVLTAALLATACADSTAPGADQSTNTESRPSPQLGGEKGNGEDRIVHLGAFQDTGDDFQALRAIDGSGTIAGQYIVVFKDEVQDVPELAKRLVETHGGTLRHIYTHTLKGFSAKLTQQAAEELRRDPQVSLVTANQIGHPAVIQHMAGGQPWGIDRIDQRTGLSQTYTYSSVGYGVYAYIIDTGI